MRNGESFRCALTVVRFASLLAKEYDLPDNTAYSTEMDQAAFELGVDPPGTSWIQAKSTFQSFSGCSAWQ
jgi:hypothetical protein